MKSSFATYEHVAKAKFTRSETINENESQQEDEETGKKSEFEAQTANVDESSLTVVNENHETKVAQRFKCMCKRGSAVSQISMKTGKTKKNEDDDTLYKISCKKVVKEEQVIIKG